MTFTPSHHVQIIHAPTIFIKVLRSVCETEAYSHVMFMESYLHHLQVKLSMTVLWPHFQETECISTTHACKLRVDNPYVYTATVEMRLH
jgi:hypothetical protein